MKGDVPLKISKPVKHSNKKPKTNNHSLEDIRQNLSPLKLSINNVDKNYPLDFSKPISFLYESYGGSNISDIIENYGSDKLGLVRMLTESRSLMNAGELRSRIRRIDMFLCVECWLKYSRRITFPGFNVVVRRYRTVLWAVVLLFSFVNALSFIH